MTGSRGLTGFAKEKKSCDASTPCDGLVLQNADARARYVDRDEMPERSRRCIHAHTTHALQAAMAEADREPAFDGILTFHLTFSPLAIQDGQIA